MKEELISVIIPIYNVETYLRKSIESILAQTYTNLEIILIDDGSTDKSGEICDEYVKKDSRIKVWHQNNQGIASVRNKGIVEATGKYIFWMDSDDYVSKNIIKELYLKLIEYEADMSICSYIQGFKRDHIFEKKEGNIEIIDAKTGLEWIYKSQKFSFIMVAAWAKLIKKSLYEGLSYPEGKVFEDIYMSHYLISRCHRIVYNDLEMYYYYQSPDSILRKKLYREKLDYLGAFEDRIHFFKENKLLELAECARVQYLHALTWEYSRAKDILHDKEMVIYIKQKYRNYYKFGIENKNVKHETKMYMFCFYIWPFGQNFMNKVKVKIWRNNR